MKWNEMLVKLTQTKKRTPSQGTSKEPEISSKSERTLLISSTVSTWNIYNMNISHANQLCWKRTSRSSDLLSGSGAATNNIPKEISPGWEQNSNFTFDSGHCIWKRNRLSMKTLKYSPRTRIVVLENGRNTHNDRKLPWCLDEHICSMVSI